MTVYEYAQEWVWRFSNATGIPKYMFLAISRHFKRTKAGELLTPALPLDEIVRSTGMSDATVRRSIEALETPPDGELEVIRSGRRGTVHRYRLRRNLKLPLMDADPSAHIAVRPVTPLTVSGAAPLTLPDVTDPHERCDRSDCAVSSVSGSGVPVQQASFRDVRTQELNNNHHQSEAYRIWFLAEYPTHHGGVPFRIRDVGKFDAASSELLTDRPLDRVQAMTLEMFAWPKDTWIGRSDHSVFVLRDNCTEIELRVAATQRSTAPRPCHYRHDPPCTGSLTACIERERQIIAARDQEAAG